MFVSSNDMIVNYKKEWYYKMVDDDEWRRENNEAKKI